MSYSLYFTQPSIDYSSWDKNISWGKYCTQDYVQENSDIPLYFMCSRHIKESDVCFLRQFFSSRSAVIQCWEIVHSKWRTYYLCMCLLSAWCRSLDDGAGKTLANYEGKQLWKWRRMSWKLSCYVIGMQIYRYKAVLDQPVCCWNLNIIGYTSQCHDCWCLGTSHHQVINSCYIAYVG